jgi:uncharacterized lipoprotein YajG
MKLSLALFIVIFAGCATASTEITTTDPKTQLITVRKTKVLSFFSASALKGFEAGKETKTTSSLLSLKEANTESEMEKLAVLLEAVVSGAVKGATK